MCGWPEINSYNWTTGIFSYEWMNEWKERNVLFNDALNTFYLWLYGVRHMVKDEWMNEWMFNDTPAQK